MPDPSSVSVPGDSWLPPSLPRPPCASSGLKTEHRRMVRLQHLAVPQIHMHAARQTRIEAAYRAHDVDSLELVRAVLLEDRSVLHRIFVRTRSAIDVARIGIPGRRRIGMVVGDLAVFDHHVMRQHAADRFVEAAADGFVRDLEIGPGLGVSGMQLRQRLLHEMQAAQAA